MITGFIWFVIACGAVLACWLLSSFVFRLGYSGRMSLSLGIPALLFIGQYWFDQLPKEDNSLGAMIGASVLLGILSALVLLPAWFVVESKLGWRAPKA